MYSVIKRPYNIIYEIAEKSSQQTLEEFQAGQDVTKSTKRPSNIIYEIAEKSSQQKLEEDRHFIYDSSLTGIYFCCVLFSVAKFHRYRSAVCSFFCCVIWFQCAKISHPWFRCLPVLQNFSVKKETARCSKHWNIQRSKRFDSSHSSSLGYYCRPLTPTTVLHQLGLWFCSCFLPKQISRNSKKTKTLQYLVNLPHSSREPCDP